MRWRAVTWGLAALAIASAAVLVRSGVVSAGHTNTVLLATLDGGDEVAPDGGRRPAGDPDGRGEVYVFGIDGDTTTLCYVLTAEKIATAAAAHIHEAPEGVNGPIVVTLAPPDDGNAADCLTEGEAAFAAGQTAAEILANPAAFYVNVHNAEFPGGAIRGQLATQG